MEAESADDAATLNSMFSVEQRSEGGVRAIYCDLVASNFVAAAELIACRIAERRIGMNSRLFDVWLNQLTCEECPQLSARDAELLPASVLENVGTPEEPAPVKHLHGLVAEQLWIDLIGEQDLGLGRPIRLEGHDWSATDPGGDGLAVHEAESGAFSFRLWESKYHGTDDPIRATVGGACRQVNARVLSYLSRFSLIAQRLTDNSQLASFYARLPEMWVDKDEAAGVSIVVGASETRGEVGCFEVIPHHFELGPERHQGQLNTVGDFVNFAERVRDFLWKGCALWIGR